MNFSPVFWCASCEFTLREIDGIRTREDKRPIREIRLGNLGTVILSLEHTYPQERRQSAAIKEKPKLPKLLEQSIPTMNSAATSVWSVAGLGLIRQHEVSMSTQLKLDEPGTLLRPGIIGRTARLLFAVLCLYTVWSVLEHSGAFLFTTQAVLARFVVAIAFAFWLFPYVVNIGFSKAWRRRPQVAVVVLLLAAAAASWVYYGGILGPPVGLVVFVWLIYVFGHLGVSFALAFVLATPGCEMRAIPHLWTLLTGRATKEHYCPGPLDRIDKWEAGRK